VSDLYPSATSAADEELSVKQVPVTLAVLDKDMWEKLAPGRPYLLPPGDEPGLAIIEKP
jgi:hypothetical protein